MEMHPLMANYRIGVLTLKAVEFELKRAEVREQEKAAKEQQFLEDLRANATKEQSTSSIHEKLQKFREKETAKNKVFTRKQDKLLFVAFYILLNLAEDINTEKKMIKKNLIPQLITLLSTRRFEV